jgi:prepilin-type N-terminal cleavage/methylation domain-containing protein
MACCLRTTVPPTELLARRWLRPKNRYAKQNGVTLVELMITIGVLSIIAAIAIPLYQGYVAEGHYASMRTTMSSLRTQIEDYQLDNSTYVGVGPTLGLAAINAGPYTYTISPGTTSYDMWGVFDANTTIWTRCQDRMNRCCDSDTPGATAANAACP